MNDKVKKFLDFEFNNGLFERSIRGYNYWIYLRTGLFMHHINKYESKETQTSKQECEKKHHHVVTFLYCFFRSPLFYRRKRGIIVYQDARKYNPETKKYENPSTQDLIERWKGKKLLLAEYTPHDMRLPLEYSDTKYVVLPAVKMYLTIHILKKTKKHRQLIRDIEKEIIPLIKSLGIEFDMSLDEKYFVESVYSGWVYHNISKKYYIKLINRIKPNAVVEQCYYSGHNMVINEVAREYGIPSIELQHGIMGASAVPYNSHYNCDNVSAYPRYIFLYSQYWKDNTHFPIQDDHVIVAGNPYLDKMIGKTKGVDKTENIILFVSQPAITNALSDFALCVAKYIEDNDVEYKIIYKLHPNEQHEYFRILEKFRDFSDICCVADAEKMDIYDCFQKCCMQVGIFSTALYEGVAAGLLTYVYNYSGCEEIEDLYLNGYAKLVNSAEEIFGGEQASGCQDDLWEASDADAQITYLRKIIEEYGQE